MKLERMIKLKPDDGFTYVRITKKDSGLSCDVLLDSLGIDRKDKRSKHPYLLAEYKKDVYIPVFINYRTVPSIPRKLYADYFGQRIPASIAEVDCWAIINAELLLKHYLHVLSDIEVYQAVTEPEQMEHYLQWIKDNKTGEWMRRPLVKKFGEFKNER